MKQLISYFPYAFLFSILLIACQSKDKNSYVWFYQLSNAGTNSSPHVIDLTGDGIKDVIIGAGANEHETTPFSVLAIDGKNGRELWRVTGPDQAVGSAIFQDINSDQVPDVFIGGRSAMLFAIDGKSGKVIWKYSTTNLEGNATNAIFNFYHPQFIPDQNHDGIQDLLVSNGGNVYSPPDDPTGRAAGVLLIMDAVSGNIIAADTMPDGQETYMSPIYYQENNQDFILFGSGGETFGGSIYQASLQQLIQDSLESAIVLLRKEGHGFVAPPTVVDITNDGVKDFVANWHGGEVIAIDGLSKEVLWQKAFPDTEANASPIPGYFNDDDVIDFFSSFQKGTWPRNSASLHWMINGKTGEVEFLDTLGCAGFASPIAIDLNEDGQDEVLLTYNDFNCFSILKDDIVAQFVSIDFKSKSQQAIISEVGKNISSTPWAGDLDNDKKIDILFVIQANYPDLLKFNGIGIGRKELDTSLSKPPTWGAYMGNDFTGVKN